MSVVRILQNKRRSFTIVELLVVVSIMGLVLSMALPAFTRMMFGGGVTAGASGIASQLRFCRSYALSKRQYVAMVVPDEKSLSNDNSNNYRCFRAARVKKPRGGSSGDWEFVNWLEDSSWATTTPGVMIVLGAGYKDLYKVDMESLGGRRQGDAQAIVFGPSGKPVVDFGKEITLTVREGFWDKVEKKRNFKGNKMNRLQIYVNSHTGRIDVLEPQQ